MRRSLLVLGMSILQGVCVAVADDKPAQPPSRLEAFVVAGTKARAADSDAPMAEGWPKGTDPGMIEVKQYPGYRSAVARGKDTGPGSDNVLFFPLFNHITKSNIAMTTPVVMNFGGEAAKDSKTPGELSMEFVYRSPTQGKPGPGVGAVKVEDHPASAFVCLGVQGELNADRSRKGTEALKTWLAAHKGEWVEDGPPRMLAYHGPMIRRDERRWELQIPVKPVPKPEKP